MTRLQAELQRLYLPTAAGGSTHEATTEGLIGPDAQVRALVLALSGPASWDTLSAVWRGVQQMLELPAPGIAVSGTDAFQLWLSLREAVPVARAQSFLESLRVHFLPDVPRTRLRLLPARSTNATDPVIGAALVPAEQGQTGHWSAFVAPDLAPVFAETPWLDIAPSPDGQADLLARLHSITPDALEAAEQRLRAARPAPVAAAAQTSGPVPVRPGTPAAGQGPKAFLRQVMRDDTVALALRIEAAKALLPYLDEPGPPDAG